MIDFVKSKGNSSEYMRKLIARDTREESQHMQPA